MSLLWFHYMLMKEAACRLPSKLFLFYQTVQKKSIITVGDKWSTFQTQNFGATSQPQYAIISADQIALTKTKYYTPNANEFIDWLKCGLDTHKKLKKGN